MQINAAQWDEFLKHHPQAHILQRSQWGDLKERFGWRAVRIVNGECGAQILFRALPLSMTIAYIPKGPIGYGNNLFSEIEDVCRKNNAIFLKIEPDIWEDAVMSFPINLGGWTEAHALQPRRTVLINLEYAEEELLGRMKQKTRYNIRLAEKKDVMVKPTNRVDEFHTLASITSTRDGFGVHALDYYQAFYNLFHPTGNCELLTAYYDGKALASLFVAKSGEMAYYMYGASSDRERNRMPTYLIQWEAMKWAKNHGCKLYDMWGIPDLEEEELEEKFLQKESHEGLWGVYRFKRGFGGETVRSVAAWDRVYKPSIYTLYKVYLKMRGGHEE